MKSPIKFYFQTIKVEYRSVSGRLMICECRGLRVKFFSFFDRLYVNSFTQYPYSGA